MMETDLVPSFLETVADGGSVQEFAKRHSVTRQTIHRWIAQDPALQSAYQAARTSAADAMVLEAHELSRRVVAGDLDHKAAEVRIKLLQWHASKAAPRDYGDRQQIDVTTTAKHMDMTEVHDRLASLMAVAHQRQALPGAVEATVIEED
jgi:transposase-like protein